MSSNFVLTLSCADRPGIVAAVTTELAGLGCNIAESNQFWDKETGQFFMRLAFTTPDGVDRDALERGLKPAVERFGMRTTLAEAAKKKKVLVMVSKFDHALLHLLYQIKVGWLDAEVAAIVSNHEDSRRTADFEGIPYHVLPVDKANKAAQEEAVIELFHQTGSDLVVLARYMQILTDELSRDFASRCINIHHSFLPSFKGGSPYSQAHQRGVKLVGATAHYVTGDLDEGPIIEQDVRRIDHRYAPSEIQALGRDIEAVVLARAVRLHLEDRVFIDGNKTVVFA